MFISWVYLIATLVIVAFGLDLVRRRKGGLHVWKQPFGYKVEYYTGKPALVVGLITSVFGFIFMLDAVRSIITGEANEFLFYTFCGGAIILLAVINIFARKHLEENN